MVDSANNLQTIQKITEIEALTKYEKEKLVQQLIHENKEIENEYSLRKEKQIRNSALLLVFTTFILFCLLYRNYRKKSLLNLKLMTKHDEIISQKEEIESQRDEIEQLNKSKDKFFAIIAHDLKNPLSGIYRLSEIMKQNYEQINSQKLKVYIEQIFISTKKTYELLENLLKWAMVQNGSLQIAATEFNLTKVIRENIELLSENANQKKLNINFNQCDDCFVLADEEMITTVLRNLLNNAIKFSPENSSIKFSISADAEFYKVSIKDQGIGISPADQQLLFNLNNDVRTIGASKEKGTGLGLVLCKEFIELNGGRIGLKSEIGKGSTFYFTVLMADKK
jgi:signal transduction histidine kinase